MLARSQGGSVPLLASTLARGSSNIKWANARCAAIANMPVQRCKEAWRAAARKRAGNPCALAAARLRKKLAASDPKRPPIPRPPGRACTGEPPPVPGGRRGNRVAGHAVSAWTRLTNARDRRDQGGVNSNLRPLPQRETIGKHLGATRVERGLAYVHVPEQDVRGYACASLAAHASRCPPERRKALAESSGRGASRAVIAQWVHGAAAPACAARHGQLGSTVMACERAGRAWDSIRAREAASRKGPHTQT